MTRRLAPLIAVAAVVLVAVIAAVGGAVRVGEPIIPFDVRDVEPTMEPTQEATQEMDEDEEVPANPLTVGIVLYTVLVGIAGIVIAIRVLLWLVGWLASRQRAARG